MGKLVLSAVIGLVTGIICFFISVAFLCFLLLIIRALSHTNPDMTLTYKAAAPVALLAALTGFTISLVRAIRSHSADSGAN
ncbi:MAG TPA: hypothetical protein VI636_18085 [Candidatus Angelobacter sp.]